MTASTIITNVKGHVLVKDGVTGEVLLDKMNAVHPANMALALARGLSNSANANIFTLKLGNGGSAVNGMAEITYQAPNITGSSADLYNATYSEVIDATEGSTPAENSVTYQESGSDDTTIVICTATVAAGEPSDQDISDSPPNPDPEAQYAFDELGLFTGDDRLLTHIIFSPILKTQNRELVITYTLTISVS